MANIQKLTEPYFADGSTWLNADNLNPIIAKINEVIEKVNGGVTPTQTVATPTISISGSTATISCSTSGATIYYTTNGNTPTTSSTQYSSPITLSGACTIKAIAVKSGMNNSQVASEDYVPSTTDITSLFSSWETGAISQTSGSEVTSTNYARCGYVDISAYQGKLLRYTNIKTDSTSGDTNGLAFYDASQVYIPSGNNAIHTSASETGYEDAVVFIPTNAKYVRLTWWNGSGTGASYHSSFHAEVSNAQITDLTSQISTWTDGKYLHFQTGDETISPLCRFENEYIDISAYVGKALNYSRIQRTNTNLSAGLIFYDSSQAYLSAQRNITNATENGKQDTTVVIPSNAKYVRLSWYSPTGSGSEWANDFYIKVITNLTM